MSEHLKNSSWHSSWQWRAIEATQAHKSKLGCILLACIGRGQNKVPRFGRQAIITSDGYVTCPFLDRHGEGHAHSLVCTVDDLVRNFRGLADHLKLSDEERIEMFAAVRKWVSTDYRPGFSGELFN
jgi:hypothetical protein